MPHSIPDAKRQEVIRLRESCKTRDQIAKGFGVGTGTVSLYSRVITILLILVQNITLVQHLPKSQVSERHLL